MSRGPGRWQRVVLDAVQAAAPDDDGLPGFVTVEDVAKCCVGGPGTRTTKTAGVSASAGGATTLTRSEAEAIRRAMRTLASSGRVTAWSLLKGGHLVVGVRRPFTTEEEIAWRRRRASTWLAVAQRTGTRYAYDRAIEARERLDEINETGGE